MLSRSDVMAPAKPSYKGPDSKRLNKLQRSPGPRSEDTPMTPGEAMKLLREGPGLAWKPRLVVPDVPSVNARNLLRAPYSSVPRSFGRSSSGVVAEFQAQLADSNRQLNKTTQGTEVSRLES